MKGISARAFMATLSTAGRLTEQVLRDRETPAACLTCEEIRKEGGFGPRHDGSPHCESGSIASGGNVSHCTCSYCF